ncbi:MAG: sugar kinase [Paucibacter sp.]|nr:sugar kinase [Roseateles sp.]
MRVASTKQVAVLGECMLELVGPAFGALQQGFGGDTLNTAVYLARCAADPGQKGAETAAPYTVHYATGLGDDRLSWGLMERWAAEGLALDLVRQIPGRMPGLYMIEVDARGERSFNYWRDTSAAKAYFESKHTPLEDQATDWDLFYLSGISLAILPAAGRERVFALMEALRARGAMVVFDNNYRPRLWASRAEAQAVFRRALDLASVGLITADDHQALFELPSLAEAVADAQDLAPRELLIKRGAEATLVRGPEAGAPDWLEAATERVERVVDTTAAGDSFAGGYLSQRLRGRQALESARFGNRLAARVIQHRGALIEPALMADLLQPHA